MACLRLLSGEPQVRFLPGARTCRSARELRQPLVRRQVLQQSRLQSGSVLARVLLRRERASAPCYARVTYGTVGTVSPRPARAFWDTACSVTRTPSVELIGRSRERHHSWMVARGRSSGRRAIRIEHRERAEICGDDWHRNQSGNQRASRADQPCAGRRRCDVKQIAQQADSDPSS